MLAKIIQPRIAQVLLGHCGVKLDAATEIEEPRLGKEGNLRCVLYFDCHDDSTQSIHFSEIDSLGFGFLQNPVGFFSRVTVSDGSIESLEWNPCDQYEFHGRSMVADLSHTVIASRHMDTGEGVEFYEPGPESILRSSR